MSKSYAAEADRVQLECDRMLQVMCVLMEAERERNPDDKISRVYLMRESNSGFSFSDGTDGPIVDLSDYDNLDQSLLAAGIRTSPSFNRLHWISVSPEGIQRYHEFSDEYKKVLAARPGVDQNMEYGVMAFPSVFTTSADPAGLIRQNIDLGYGGEQFVPVMVFRDPEVIGKRRSCPGQDIACVSIRDDHMKLDGTYGIHDVLPPSSITEFARTAMIPNIPCIVSTGMKRHEAISEADDLNDTSRMYAIDELDGSFNSDDAVKNIIATRSAMFSEFQEKYQDTIRKKNPEQTVSIPKP